MTKRLIRVLAVLTLGGAQLSAGKLEAPLALTSSDTRLVEAFNWARRQATAYVFNGDPVGPWYEAALPGREAFCMRDVSHQSTGAHALSLSRYTYNMLHRFAENISDSKDWCSYWEIDRYNRPAPVDYRSDAEFWYNLPANFDVLDACYRMYQWTGDLSYLNDPVLLNFYDRTVADYVERWDLGVERVMKRKRTGLTAPAESASRFRLFRGDPSYIENSSPFVLGVDLLASQYAAYLAYSRIQQLRGNPTAAQTYSQKAAAVKKLVNDGWWNDSEHHFYSTLSKDYKLEGHFSRAVLYYGIAEDGPKARGALDDLIEGIRKQPSGPIEEESHHAEILYRYGVPDRAYEQLMDFTRADRERREYPEVSYSVIGAIVSGMMGITVEPSSPMQDRVVRNPLALCSSMENRCGRRMERVMAVRSSRG
jgi:hypothetical protein